MKEYEKPLGLDYTSTLDTVNNLGVLYTDQGKLKEAEEMYQIVDNLGLEHPFSLLRINNLAATL